MKKLLFLLFLPLNLLAIDPDMEYILTPDSIGWEYEQLMISTEDGYDLNTWVYKANPENIREQVLILAYPDAGNMSYFVYHASILANLGYTVTTFDYRGFGKSSVFDIKSDYLFQTEFATDLEAVVDYAKDKLENKSLGIWAWSMGTMVTTYAFADIKDQIDFLIYDAFVFKPTEHIERLKTQKGKDTFSPLKNEEYIQKWNSINVPILLFVGEEDELTTAQDAHSNQGEFDVKPSIKVYDGGHLMGFQHSIKSSGFGGWYSSQIDLFIKNLH